MKQYQNVEISTPKSTPFDVNVSFKLKMEVLGNFKLKSCHLFSRTEWEKTLSLLFSGAARDQMKEPGEINTSKVRGPLISDTTPLFDSNAYPIVEMKCRTQWSITQTEGSFSVEENYVHTRYFTSVYDKLYD